MPPLNVSTQVMPSPDGFEAVTVVVASPTSEPPTLLSVNGFNDRLKADGRISDRHWVVEDHHQAINH